METYRYYPPQIQSTLMPYEVITAGSSACQHELLQDDWRDHIAIQDGLVFVTFSCKRCGRQVCQSLEEVLPPRSWKGGNGSNQTNRIE